VQALVEISTNRTPVQRLVQPHLISWDLGGAIPSSLDTARINLNFTMVPEPGTALLMGLGLLSLGVACKSRREESDSTD
jgi:hypothetical protein